MANGVWKVVYPTGFERSRHLLLHKFFDEKRRRPRKERQTRKEKIGENRGPLTSLPVNCLNSDRLKRRQNSFERKGMQKVGFKRMELWG